MEIKEFSEIFDSYLKDLNIKLNEEQIEKFYIYMNLLIDWNKKINLTAITKPEEIILKHFVDCVQNHKEPRVSGEQALNALRVVWQIKKVLKNNA